MAKCPYCGNSLFPGQIRCEECGKLEPKEKKDKKNKEEK